MIGMPIFIVDNNPGFLLPLALSPSDAHHLVRVKRIQSGELIKLTDNRGGLATALVENTQPLSLRLLDKTVGEKPCPVTLCLPLIEQTRMEWAIEKLCELNVAVVQLLVSERCQSRTLAQNKMQRLLSAAIAAQKQCERCWPILILPPVTLMALNIQPDQTLWVGSAPGDKADSIDTGDNTKSTSNDADCTSHIAQRLSQPFCLHALVPSFPRELVSSCAHELVLFVGPEGGLTNREQQWLKSHNTSFLSLGHTVLRTETAAIALASVACCQQDQNPKPG